MKQQTQEGRKDQTAAINPTPKRTEQRNEAKKTNQKKKRPKRKKEK